MDNAFLVGYSLPIQTRTGRLPGKVKRVVSYGNSCATLTMAEKTIFDPHASRAAEASSRRLPFAPIFDTIVAEPPPQNPLTTKEPSTKVFALRGEDNGFRKNAVAESRNKPVEPSLRRGGALAWILVAAFLILAAGIILQNMWFAREERTLTQLLESTSKLQSSLLDASTQEHRPWITLSELMPQPLSVAPGAFAMTLGDSGKSPATDVKVAATARVTGVPNASESPGIESVNRSVGTIFPGSQLRTVLDFHPSAAVFTTLFRGHGTLEVHVNVSYQDIQHNSHVTQSCWQWTPVLRRMEPCSGFGTVN